jgi:hypothetical protein
MAMVCELALLFKGMAFAMESVGNYVWIALAGGAAAFAHCLGMCGGFALHLSSGQSRRSALARQLLWHLGKTTSYVFLGALAGFCGGLVGSFAQHPWIQNLLAYFCGAVMLAMGLSMLGVLPSRDRRKSVENSGGLFSSLFRQFFREPTPAAALALGLVTGFLPCPIVLGFLALSLESGSVAGGMATMAALGLGTVWALLLLGLTGSLMTLGLRRWGAAVAGVVLLVLGVATVLRGTEMFHQLLGCPRVNAPAATSAGAVEGSSCCQPEVPPCCQEKNPPAAPKEAR